MERNAPPPVEVTLPDGSVAEVDGTTEFTSRVDKMEDRVNDGARYKGLLTKDAYDQRKQRLHDKLRQEADPEKYKLEKLEVRARRRGGSHLIARHFHSRASPTPRPCRPCCSRDTPHHRLLYRASYIFSVHQQLSNFSAPIDPPEVRHHLFSL